MNELMKEKVGLLLKEVSFGKKDSIFKFYTHLLELMGDVEPTEFLRDIKVYHKDVDGEMSLFDYIEHENNSNESLYLCKILSLSKDYTFSGKDIFLGIFLPFIKESLTKKGISKVDYPIYNELLSLENIELLFSENIFRGTGNLNRFLKPLKKTNNYKIFEKNLDKPEILSIFFDKFVNKKIKILMRDDWPYYFENLLNLIKNYPELLNSEIKTASKKIKLQEHIIKESPFLTYKYLKDLDDDIQNILPVYIAETIKKLNKNSDIYNTESLRKFKEENSLDFRLIEEHNNWEHITLENGQDLLSIYCINEDVSSEKIEEWLSKEGFRDFLEKRSENFIVDITKRGFYNNIMMLIKKHPFLNEKENKEIVLDSIIKLVIKRKGISLEKSFFSEDEGHTYSVLSQRGIPAHLIFGTLEQQKNWYMSNNNMHDFYFFEKPLEDVSLNENGKKIKEELFHYNNKQKDYKERKKYADFIFECNKIYSIVNRYPTRTTELNGFMSYLLEINISGDELKSTQVIKNIMDKNDKYKLMLNSVIEKKKLLETMREPEFIQIKSDFKKRL